MVGPDIRKLAPTHSMKGEDASDTELLRQMLDEATRYLVSNPWCPAIVDSFLGFGVGGVVAVFLFRFAAKIDGSDDALWVVVGDLPSAYFVVDEAPDVKTALEVYCDLMEDWMSAVAGNEPMDAVFPVDAAATKENAKLLESRIRFLRTEVIPTV